MGVTGLWKLIEPCGKPVPVETLEGKVLAVDISIWLHQVVKGFQDNKGAALNNAHLLGLFYRLCKLMYYRVKPVFVFDGCVPQLKRDTIARRQQQRNKISNEADRIQSLLLQSLAKEKVVQMALGPNAELLLASPVKKKVQSKIDSVDDMFKLPDLPESSKKTKKLTADESMDDSFEDSFCSTEDYTSTSPSADDSSYDESNPRNAYSSNLQAIDVRSNDFKQLPADVRHDILVDIKETRKQSSWGRLHELPSRSDDFSSFQMKRLLKRRQVQVSLEEAEKEMGNDHALTFSELTNIFSEEGILESETLKKGTKQISSSENTRYLLVRDLKKKIKKCSDIEGEEGDGKEKTQSSHSRLDDNLPSTSKSLHENKASLKSKDELGLEYNADLELAIALSLQEDQDKVYDEKDYEYDSDETLKLNKDQRKQLKNAAKGPAAAYMIEYGGMNKEEVKGIIDKTQVNEESFDDTLDVERLVGDVESKQTGKTDDFISKPQVTIQESQSIQLHVSEESDSTDSDLEEVVDEETKPAISITVNFTEVSPPEDDLFAEVFKEDECIIQETPEFPENPSNVKCKLPLNVNIKLDPNKTVSEEDLFADDLKSKHKERIKSTLEDECVIDETPPVVKREDSLPSQQDVNASNRLVPTVKKEDMLSILEELKQQAVEIKNINLESIKLDNSVVEISDDEVPPVVKDEIIEICDSDDGKRPTTPPPGTPAQQSPNSHKSPKFKTPSKNHSITEFFNVNYVVKRTPDKPQPEEGENSDTVKSPFFVKKTPKSNKKSGSNSPSTSKKASNASKTLFDQQNVELSSSHVDSVDDGVIALPIETVSTEVDIIKEAAELLKSHKTSDELNDLATSLAKDRRDLEAERNRQDRMGMSITQRMNSDCQELLKLFGVPFIVAPMEAEAQCAFLDIVQLTNGTITDDSDIWLFGGRTVYKNFFAQNKNVMEFRSEQIEKNFNCDRKKLIQLACLVGSDYTTGIHGIGAVTAMEILATFTPKESSNNPETSTLSTIQNIVETLQRFRSWWQSFKAGTTPPGSSSRLALQKKLKNIEMLEGFPNISVIEAYLAPKVDENREALSWGYPDVESLREFAKKTFGWTNSKTDDILMPVIKKLNEKKMQQSIRNYFNVKNALSLRQIKVSKRVQNAIDKMTGNVDSDESSEKPTKAKRSGQAKKPISKKNKAPSERQTDLEVNSVNTLSLTIDEGRDNQAPRGPVKRAPKRANIPAKNDVIPQREKSIAKLEANKALAAEILKSTAKEVKRKRKT